MERCVVDSGRATDGDKVWKKAVVDREHVFAEKGLQGYVCRLEPLQTHP